MNRYVKLILGGAVAAMLALAVGAIAWRLQMPPELATTLPARPLAPFILLAVPAVLAGILLVSARDLDARIAGISEDNTRHVQGTLVFLFLFVTACQAWMAFMYVGAILPKGDGFIRAAAVLAGVAMAVRGNFLGKVSPPATGNPPDLGVWGRAARRMGWLLVAMGAGLTVCAMALPLRPLFAVLLLTAAALLLVDLAHGRAVKPRPR